MQGLYTKKYIKGLIKFFILKTTFGEVLVKVISDNQPSYIPLWIYTGKNSEGLNKQLPFTELGTLFFNELSVKIKDSCIYSVNASSWNDFLSKDSVTIYNVLSFVLKYLWECENIRVPFMNKCDTITLKTNAQILQKTHLKLANEKTDLKSRWRNNYIADMYSEYADYIINHCDQQLRNLTWTPQFAKQ